MKKVRILALFLAMTMLVFTFTACDNNKKNNDNEGTAVGTVDVEKTNTGFPEKLTAEKIGSVDNKRLSVSESSGCFYKADDGKYGIITADGKKDTGAKYVYAQPFNDGCFEVASKEPTENSTVSELNCFGIVGPTGEEVVPQKYAYFDHISDRYLMACEITEITENEDEALVYYTNDLISLYAADDDVLYKGNWYVYDIITGKMLEGITGTKAQDIEAYGLCIEYKTDDGKKVVINANGEKIPEDAKMFENGYYIVEGDTEGTLYNPEGKKVITYNLKNDFAPCYSTGDCFLALKEDDVAKYAFMDTTGKIISAEFVDSSSEYNDNPRLYGNFVFYEGKVHNLEGNVIVDGTFESVWTDEITENAWILKAKDDKHTLIKDDGTVLYEGIDGDPISINAVNEFSFCKEVDDKKMYYSLKDKDYTIEGSCLYGWLIEVTKEDDTYNIVDAISGKTIIEGYADYDYVSVNSGIYLYAEKADGTFDVFEVK